MPENIWNVITLHYHKRRSFTLAESFDELTPVQFIKIASLVFDAGDELACQVQALRILSGMNTFRWLLLKPSVINNALPYVEWVFVPQTFTRQLLPVYKGYYGPASDFDNLRMKEFHFCELFYSDVIAGSVDALECLVSVLYRKGKKGYDKKRDPDGDIRIEFNHNETPYHVIHIRQWPAAVKHAIFLWYDSCRQELIENNPRVFKAGGEGSDSEFDDGLYGTMLSLAGEKLGTVEKIESMYVHTAMLTISRIKKEEADFEEKLKQQPK